MRSARGEVHAEKVVLAANAWLSALPELSRYLDGGDKEYYRKLAGNSNAKLEFGASDNLHLNDYQFFSTLNGQKIDV